MADTTVAAPTTAEELLALGDDHLRHELVRGELTTMAPAGGEHGIITAALAHLVRGHVLAHDLGMVFGAETGFLIERDPDTVRAPDLAFVRRERVPPGGLPRGYWPGAPDLAAEVVSPGDAYEEVQAKVRQWLASGVRLVWVVEPRTRTVAVHDGSGTVRLLDEAEDLTAEDLLPGWRCRVAELLP